MALSWGTTLVYLYRHMKRMETSGNSFFSSRLRSQLRVTILGIVQTGLHTSCSFLAVMDWFYLSRYDQQDYITSTAYSLFSFGSTVVLGLGQSMLAFSTMSCGVWLRLFYYTKIVPAQRAFSVWIKRNIKTIVYCGLVEDRLFLSLELFYAATTFSSLKNRNVTLSSMNETIILFDNALYSTGTFSVLQLIYVIFFIGTMTLSGVGTLVYLCRHMKRMETSDSPFSSSRVKTQLRVTIMGIIQTCLHAICFLLILLGWFHIEYHLAGYRVVQTIYSLFSFGTIVNLGFGQSLLRHRANFFKTSKCMLSTWGSETQSFS
uniref:Taste receptor type 2 n=1 Tax=Scleropages formosus TaxID=113540 RepID=A0A8C9TRK5_SCLFO